MVESRYIVGMKVITVIRPWIALLLCLLLPLQAGATLARATAMARHGAVHRVAVQTVAPPAAQEQAISVLAHHGHHGHVAHGHSTGSKATSDKLMSHQAKHAKAGCADCAKCCLQAASAPPPMLPAVFVPAVARASFTAQHAPVPAFLTDGPERPPRHLNA